MILEVIELGIHALQAMMGLSLMGQALIHLVMNLKIEK